MASVLFGLLRHQADVRHGTHRGRVIRPVCDAVVDNHLVDAGVAAVGDGGFDILQIPCSVPHLARRTDHGGHRSVNDHVARHVEIGDAVVRVNHGEVWTVLDGCRNVSLDLGLLVGREIRQRRNHVSKTIVGVGASFGECPAVLREDVREVRPHGMAEDDRVRHLHHRRLQV